jgi:hypothetical protein
VVKAHQGSRRETCIRGLKGARAGERRAPCHSRLVGVACCGVAGAWPVDVCAHLPIPITLLACCWGLLRMSANAGRNDCLLSPVRRPSSAGRDHSSTYCSLNVSAAREIAQRLGASGRARFCQTRTDLSSPLSRPLHNPIWPADHPAAGTHLRPTHRRSSVLPACPVNTSFTSSSSLSSSLSSSPSSSSSSTPPSSGGGSEMDNVGSMPAAASDLGGACQRCSLDELRQGKRSRSPFGGI